jgi:hypothetical protein
MPPDVVFPGMDSVDYNPRTYAIASAIVRLALDGMMPVDKVMKDVNSDCVTVLERLGWTPPKSKI